MPGRSLEALAVPGKFLLNKIAELKKQQQEQSRRKVTERELAHLHHKIDKLLIRLEEHELEPAQTQEEECAICISAKATMQTFPCGHRVVCRKCFVKTIQMAVSQRLLPLRCVICRAKILRLKQLSSSSGGSHSQSLEAMPRPLDNTPPSFVSSKVGFFYPSTTIKLPPRSGQVFESRQPLPPRVSSFRAARRQMTTNRPLIPIPETEELEIVHSVRQVYPSSVCPDFGSEVWAMQKDLKIEPSGKKRKNEKQRKWWSRLCQFHTPSLIKNIRNKYK